jgi:hypothetical protein
VLLVVLKQKPVEVIVWLPSEVTFPDISMAVGNVPATPTVLTAGIVGVVEVLLVVEDFLQLFVNNKKLPKNKISKSALKFFIMVWQM